MASTGPAFGTAATNDPANGGTVDWTSTGNVFTDDGNTAHCEVDDDTTKLLKITDYEFPSPIPPGATITGISLTVKKQGSAFTGFIRDHTIQLVKGGSAVGSNKAATGVNWGIFSGLVVTYGGDGDLWGTTWSSSDFDSDFGAAIAAQLGPASGTVDYAAIEVFFEGEEEEPLTCAFRGLLTMRSNGESMWYLRQSTASQEVPLGPFVDDADGKTAETALSIANTDIKIQKTGATSLVSKTSGGATHMSDGNYYAVLDATDTNTIGPMRIYVQITGALAVWLDCVVLDEAIYDWHFGTTAPSTGSSLDAAGIRTALGMSSANLDTLLSGIQSDTNDIQTRIPSSLVSGRMDSNVGAMASSVLTASAIASDAITAAKLHSDVTTELQTGLATATNLAAAKTILDKLDDTLEDDSGTYRFTEHALGEAPAGGGGSGPTAEEIADEVQTRTLAAVTVVNGMASGVITANSIASNAITAAKIATDAIGASQLAADAISEIQSGLATASALATVDTVVDAILVDTSEIGSAGAGLTAVPWNAAWDAEVQSEVDDALVAQNLDHLVKSAVDTDFATTVHLNSVIGHLSDNGSSATFDRTTDSLEAVRDRGDAAWATASASSIRSAVGLAAANLDTQLGSANGVLAKIDDTLEDDGGTYRFTENALEEGPVDAGMTGPTAEEIADEVQTRTIAGVTLVETVTDLTNLPAAPTDWWTADAVKADAVTKIQNGLATPTNIAAGTITTVTNVTNAPTNGDFTSAMKSSLNAATPVVTISGTLSTLDAIWNKIKAWLGAIAGKSADVVTRAEINATTAGATYNETTDSLEAIRERGDSSWTTPIGFSTLEAGDLRDALGLADPNLDEQLALLPAVKAKTDNLPASPAAVGSAMTLTNAYDAAKTAATQASVDDLPTNAELASALTGTDSAVLTSIGDLNNLSAADVGNQLALYDAPTRSEMDAAFTEIKGSGWNSDASLKAIRGRGDAAWLTATGFATSSSLTSIEAKLDTIDGNVELVLADTDELQNDWKNGGRLDNILDARAAQSSVDDLPTNAEFSSAVTAANDAVLEHLELIEGATFDTATDSLEALRNRGDVAWATPTEFSTLSAADVWAFGSRVLTAGTNIVLAKGAGVTGFNDLSAAQVNAEVESAIVEAGLATAANLALVKSDTASILADTDELQTDWANDGRLDVILDGRASQGTVDAIDEVVDAILVDTAEIGVAGAGLTALASQASVSVIDDFLDTEITAIKAKTDNLPSDPADASDIAGSLATVNSNLTTIAASVDTEIAAIKTVTDQLATTLELSGSVYRFTVGALELGPSGPMGPGTVYVYPLASTMPGQTLVSGGITQAFRYTPLPSGPIAIFDANEDPVNLNGVVLKMIATSTTEPGEILELSSAANQLVVGGVNHNQVSVSYTPVVEGEYEWKLYRQEINPDNWTVLAIGFWNIVDGENPAS